MLAMGTTLAACRVRSILGLEDPMNTLGGRSSAMMAVATRHGAAKRAVAAEKPSSKGAGGVVAKPSSKGARGAESKEQVSGRGADIEGGRVALRADAIPFPLEKGETVVEAVKLADGAVQVEVADTDTEAQWISALARNITGRIEPGRNRPGRTRIWILRGGSARVRTR
jgi:hypothetical protein